MKKLLMSASAFALLALVNAAPASAECDGPYVALRGGVVKHDISGGFSSVTASDDINLDKDRLMISGALGYRYEHWRGEFEYVWRKHTSDGYSYEGVQWDESKFKSYSYMLNAYYDVFPYNWWTPYVGVGIGLTQLKYSNIDYTTTPPTSNVGDGNYKPLNFTWSVGAGLSLKVTNRWNVDVGYRYYDMGHIRHADADAQEIYGGVRYVF